MLYTFKFFITIINFLRIVLNPLLLTLFFNIINSFSFFRYLFVFSLMCC